MKICHVCAAECADEAELCPVCGAELVAEETHDMSEATTIENPVLAASVEDVVTAEIFHDMLIEAGIPFTTDESEVRLTFGGSLVAEEVYVDEKNLEEAQRIYEEVLNSEPEFDMDFDGEFEGEFSEEYSEEDI